MNYRIFIAMLCAGTALGSYAMDMQCFQFFMNMKENERKNLSKIMNAPTNQNIFVEQEKTKQQEQITKGLNLQVSLKKYGAQKEQTKLQQEQTKLQQKIEAQKKVQLMHKAKNEEIALTNQLACERNKKQAALELDSKLQAAGQSKKNSKYLQDRQNKMELERTKKIRDAQLKLEEKTARIKKEAAAEEARIKKGTAETEARLAKEKEEEKRKTAEAKEGARAKAEANINEDQFQREKRIKIFLNKNWKKNLKEGKKSLLTRSSLFKMQSSTLLMTLNE